MVPDRIDVPKAREVLEKEGSAVYLDVRTEAEFADGHPAGAINIPIGTPNPLMQRFDLNPNFLDVVRATIPEAAPIVVGCRSGPRAEMAASLLTQNGYPNVSWVVGGFHGLTDPMGIRIAPGWRELGFPESRNTGDGIGYASLLRKTGKL